MNREDILRHALDLTGAGGERNSDYGDPVVNHMHIAEIANAILGRDLSAREIALILTSVKLARLAKSPTHIDSHADACADLGITFECATAGK